MNIRMYIIGATLFLIFAGWFVFAFISQGDIQPIDLINGYYIPEMPLAIAILIPTTILALLSLLHMLFYRVVEYIQNKSRNSDFRKLEGAIFMNLKGKVDDKPQYTTKLYRDMGELLSVSKIVLNNGAELNDGNKFKKIVDNINAIKNGAVLQLDHSVGYHIKELNYWNMLREDSHSAESILMERGFYSDELYAHAFAHLCKFATYSTIQRYMRWFNIEALFSILQRVDAEVDGLDLGKGEILDLISSVPFSRDSYTRLAKTIKYSSMSPDFRLELFKHLIEKSDEAIEGYLYTLLNLEMTKEAEETIQEHQVEHIDHIKAYITLKKHSPNLLDLDYFFDRNK